MWNSHDDTNGLPESWKEIRSLSELSAVIDRSHENPVVIFKHSTRCSRSAYAKHRLEQESTGGGTSLPIYYLDLIAHRNVSNEIAQRLEITHQSPQLLLVKNGKVIHHSSHESISLEKAAKFT